MIEPVKLQPIFKQRIWGGDALARIYGKNLPQGLKIGESWELTDLAEDQSTVANGSLAGLTMRRLFADYGCKLGLNDEQIQPPFGLLIKFLDAQDDLSVQVHPDAQVCKRFPDARLKTECWYVLHAQPGSCLYKGLKPGVTREQFAQAIETGGLEKLMQRYEVKPGDFHPLPAGTVHALGAGVMVAEIQTPSDTTYRVYDWNRVDSQGNSRELHIEQALASIHFDSTPPPTSDNISRAVGQQLLAVGQQLGQAALLLANEFFSVVKVNLSADRPLNLECEFPFVIIMLSGHGDFINGAKTPYLNYTSGDTMIIPGKQRYTLKPVQPGDCLLTCLGPKKPD